MRGEGSCGGGGAPRDSAGSGATEEGPYDFTVEVRNRFKGLDLIDRVPDELWSEVRDIVQETGIKTIPTEKKCKKAKWLSWGALQIAVKKRSKKQKRKGQSCPPEQDPVFPTASPSH